MRNPDYRLIWAVLLIMVSCVVSQPIAAGAAARQPPAATATQPDSLARTVADEAVAAASKVRNPLQRAFALAECARLMSRLDERKAQELVAQADKALADAERKPTVGERLLSAVKAAIPAYVISLHFAQSPFGPKPRFEPDVFAGHVASAMLWQEAPMTAAGITQADQIEAFAASATRRRDSEDPAVELVQVAVLLKQYSDTFQTAVEAQGRERKLADARDQARAAILVARSGVDPAAAVPMIGRISDLEYRRVALMSILAKLPQLAPELQAQACELVPASMSASEAKKRAVLELHQALSEAATADAECVAAWAERATDPLVQSAALRAVGLAIRASDPGRAAALLENAIEAAFKVDSNDLRCALALDGIEALASCEPQKALSCVGRIEDPEARAMALWRVAGQVVAASKRDALLALTEAAEWALKISDNKQRIRMLLTMSVAMGGLDPSRSAQLFDSSVREIPSLPNESDQVELLNLARDCAQALREGGAGQVAVPAEVTEKRVAGLRAALDVAGQIKDPRQRCLALWRAANQLSPWDPQDALPGFEAGVELFKQSILPKYRKIDGDRSAEILNAASVELWPVLRMAGAELARVDRAKAQQVFDDALQMAHELTVFMPAKPGKYGVWGLARSDVDPGYARGYATMMVACELAWMDRDAAVHLIETTKLPPIKVGGLLGAGAALGSGLARLLGHKVPPNPDETIAARASGLLHVAMIASQSEPEQALALFERGLDLILEGKYDWRRSLGRGQQAVERGAQQSKKSAREETAEKPREELPQGSIGFADDVKFCQKLISGLHSVSSAPSLSDAAVRTRVIDKVVSAMKKAVPEFTRTTALCEVARFAASFQERAQN